MTHSYGLELRPGDNEPNGFLLSSCEIVPTGREIMAALKAITPILEKEKNAGVKVEGGEKRNKMRRNANRQEEAQVEQARRDERQQKETRRGEKKRDKTRRVKTNLKKARVIR